MPKICYVPKRFNRASRVLIEQANEIIAKYQADGYSLTIRQIYYQFVAHDLFPEERRWTQKNKKWVRDPNGTKNAYPNYKHLGSIINDSRLAGLTDWDAIEDRTRNLKSLAHWDTPKEILEACSRQYRVDKWATQEYRPEVWIEKDALVGVIEGVCNKYDVPYFACRGYNSQSEMWGAAMRMRNLYGKQMPYIIHLGDHDPSGIDMTRDIEDRMSTFGVQLEFKRIALNMDQVRKYNPPPNFAKMSDTRIHGYVAEFGDDSWELDALEPKVIGALIEKQIKKLLDKKLWESAVEEEEEARQQISDFAEEF